MKYFFLLRQILDEMPLVYRRRMVWVVGLLAINSLTEFVSLGALVPIIMLILNESSLDRFPIARQFFQLLGIATQNGTIIFCMAAAATLLIGKNVFGLWVNKQQARFAYDLFYDMSTKMHRDYYRRGYLFLRQSRVHEVVRDIVVVSGRFADCIIMPILYSLNELLVFVSVLVALLFYDYKAVFLVSAVLGLGFWLTYGGLKKRMRFIEERFHDVSAALYQRLYQSIYGYADVKTTNSEEYFFKAYATKAREQANISISRYAHGQAPQRLIDSLVVMSVFLVVYYGLNFLPSKAELVTLLGVMVFVAYRTMPMFNRITLAILNVRSYLYVMPILKASREHAQKSHQKSGLTEDLPFARHIKFQNVYYRYPGQEKDTLQDINITIGKGQCVGVVGRSAAGKTTFLNTFLGFLPPSRGTIYIDDLPLLGDSVDSWHRLIGYVQQEVYLTEGSLRENIAFGRESSQIDPGRLAESIERASLSSLIRDLPKGLETMVGERGAELSVGQKQRIGIARALYSGAQVLIFDEATASLDLETESEITDTIKGLIDNGLTVIIVAHRLSTLRHCNFILRLADGTIQSVCSYDEIRSYEQEVAQSQAADST